MRRWIVAALALLPAACGRVADVAAGPDATYTLALYEHKQGDLYRVTRTRMSETDATASAGHRGGTSKVVTKEKVVYTEELLEQPAGATRATRLRRTYEAVDRTRSGAAVKSALVGKAVEVDRTGASTKFTIDGRPPTAEQAKEVEADFVAERGETLTADLLPGRPVKVGETWAIDRGKVAAALPAAEGLKFELEHARASGKLVKVTHHGGRAVATAEFTVRVPVAEIGVPGQPWYKTDGESGLTVILTADFPADGSAPTSLLTHDARGRVGAKLSNNGLLTMHYHATGTTTEEMPPKK